ncbi:uncharacterized protein LOC128545938 [Mercenaria mercenaria]|uniref:uncharacterized protein LOC128545938 n=1 Tax=Mercenaria mercenaria TaxID=6596 RepID=UPI001E1D2396|nr:uncharacterized protein LOC128545938 [Mercenaria mercenaria]
MYKLEIFWCYISMILAGVKHVCSEEPYVSRYMEEKLLEKMTEIDIKMQIALGKLDKMEETKNRQRGGVSSLLTSGPRALLVKNLEDDGWEMIFRATSGNGQNAYEAWTTGVGTCVDKPISMARSYASHYRNGIISNWANIGIKYVKYAYYDSTQEVAYVIFNASGSDMNSWFDKTRVISSSYSDLTAVNNFNHFSILGDFRSGALERRFLINRSYGGCDGDYGHLVVSENEPPNTCNWDKHPTYPQFLYSKINSVDYWGRRMFGRADYMAIFIKTN